MRLLLLTSEFPPGPGGIASHAYQVALRLSGLSWEVAVLSPQEYASLEEIQTVNRSQPFKVVRLKSFPSPPISALYRFAKLYSWVKSWKPDVLLASGERPVWLTALLAGFLPLRWVAVGHGLEFGTSVPWQRQLSRRAFSRADAIICVSNYTRGRMLEMGITPKLDVVVPNGADENSFHLVDQERIMAFRRSLGLEHNPLLLTVGQVTERKGQDIVIRALPLVLKTAPEVHYLLVGLPTLKEPLTSLARDLGVADRVHFLGRLGAETLATAYNACDVYIMTSRHSRHGDFEGYGIAAVEAAFCGKPAVVSAGSGLEEAVSAGETGLVVPEDDPRATAAAIARLLNNVTLRQRLGRKARERAVGEQTWANRIVQYDRVLKTIAAGGCGVGKI